MDIRPRATVATMDSLSLFCISRRWKMLTLRGACRVCVYIRIYADGQGRDLSGPIREKNRSCGEINSIGLVAPGGRTKGRRDYTTSTRVT